MTTDTGRRGAARIATLVAVPIALAVLLISALTYGGLGTDEPRAPGPAATGPVPMTAPALPPGFVPVCQQIVANLPDAAAGHARRPVTDGLEQNAAYGDPPITLACGTGQPTYPPTDRVYSLSGVCWHAMVGTTSTAWTTVDRVVPVTVTVPGASDGSSQSVIPFSEAIGTNDPLLETFPSGCS